jgi:GT2 family glycosyltransferase
MPSSPHPLVADLSRVTAVLVTYHSGHCAAELGECLNSLPHVTIVDNASTDDTVTRFRQHLPHAQVMVMAQNLGFGAANNRGIAAAETEFVLLLNPDCVIDVNAISALVHCADAYPDAALIAPQLVDRNEHLDISYSWTPHTWASKGPGADADTCIGFASGACMLIRRNAMQRIKGFDEDFFLYYEDTDLCMRLAKQCGPLIVTPQAHVMHKSRGSSSGRARFKAEYLRGYHHIQSKFLFEKKHLGKQVSTVRRLRYAIVAALETLARVLVLDFVRATRVLGRVVGAWRYPDDMTSRQARS